MWIAAVVVPLLLLAVPLWLAHLEDRVISGVRPRSAPEATGGLRSAPDLEPVDTADMSAPVPLSRRSERQAA